MSLEGIRTILVPADIVPVQRRSPLPARKRTPWRPQPEGAATERPGGREWFSDHLFVEAQDGHPRAGYGTSVTMHVCCGVVLLSAMVARPLETPIVRIGRSLVMPAMVSIVPVAEAATAAPRSRMRPAPDATPPPAAVAPAATLASAPAAGLNAVAPIEAPSRIEPETGIESSAGPAGVEGGVANATSGGFPDGTAGSGSSSPGSLRVGDGGIRPPRKIKDVKPVYPLGAVSDQARGIVIIEATIGVDGKVHDARILRSIPPLDRAALDAVRQWEYAPSVVNGVPVAVIMTIIVNFAIL